MKWNKWLPWKADGRGENLSRLRSLAAEDNKDGGGGWAWNGDTLVLVSDRGDGVLEAAECKVLRTCTTVRPKR